MVLKNLSSKPLITITNSEKTIDSNKTSDVKVNKNNLSKSMDENKKEVLQTSDSLKDIVEDITTNIKVENLDIIKENKKTSEAGKEDEADEADEAEERLVERGGRVSLLADVCESSVRVVRS